MIGMKIVSRGAFAAAILFSLSSAAGAAPQVLGLVATLSPTPLLCDGDNCKAEFSSFCLQKERAVPHAKWQYEVATGGALHLLLTGAGGSTWQIEAAPHIAVHAPRGFTAVEISVSAAALKALGATAAAVVVGEGVALAPADRADDEQPLSTEEKAFATGPLRQLGSRIVDHDPDVLMTTRVLNGLINALPDTVQVGARANEVLWARALSTGLVARDGDANHTARQAYDACWRNAPVAYGLETVRHCVQVRHDSLMIRKTRAYWDSVQAGS